MVSVIVISYNTKELTLRCLGELDKSIGVETEIIVVDNASSDGSVEAIAKKYPDIRLIRNNTNVGFGVANNQAMKIAKGEYFLLLNSDCFVKKNTINDLIKAAQVMPDTDVVGCKLLNSDGSLQPSYGYFPNLFRILMLMFFLDNLPVIKSVFSSIHVRSAKRYNQITSVDWVMGALMFMKREVFEKVGGFDEKYFMYGEEVEWQYRIKKSGFKVRYIPQTEVVHIGGGSSKDKYPAIIGEIKSWKFWIFKYAPNWQQKLVLPIIKAGCWLRIWFKPKEAWLYRKVLNDLKTEWV